MAWMIGCEWNNVGLRGLLVKDRGEEAAVDVVYLHVEKRKGLADGTNQFDIGM